MVVANWWNCVNQSFAGKTHREASAQICLADLQMKFLQTQRNSTGRPADHDDCVANIGNVRCGDIGANFVKFCTTITWTKHAGYVHTSTIPNTKYTIENDIEHWRRLRSSVDLGGSEESSEAAPRQKKSQPSVKTVIHYYNISLYILVRAVLVNHSLPIFQSGKSGVPSHWREDWSERGE